ncbi:universal stress protein [Pedococcus sp. KACC 23699]|uniref:Universal stress protein n=1 Tax=Pedococcus sp. KACC 23699 TaxID=3149228 RepID=A0AAU7JSS1_9MICO
MVVGAQQDPAVVVGCDGSWESMEAVDVAVEEAARRRLHLVVLTIEDEADRGVRHLGDWSRATSESTLQAEATGRRAVERIGSRWSHVTVVSAETVESPQVEALAARARLLVVGRHGSRGLGAFASGSTSEQLVRRLGCPVLVAGPRPAAPRISTVGTRHPVVVVGVDDEPSADVVLSIAVEAAQSRGWALTVVYAAPRADAELHVLAARIWDRHADLLLSQRAPDHSLARVVVDVTQPVAALLTHAGPQDLLVVGTEGQGRLAGLISGSVARGVLDQMPCDVLVVPPAAVLAHRPAAHDNGASPVPAVDA